MSQERIPVQTLVVGGGAVGLATALAFAEAGTDVVVVEREKRCGAAQSARNSGVIHAGIYYAPESLKARLCIEGRDLLYRFCRTHRIPHQNTGKIIMATTVAEEAGLAFLYTRAKENGLERVKMLTAREIAHREPNLRGRAALWVPQSGIIESAAYMSALERMCRSRSITILTQTMIETIAAEPILTVGLRDSGGRYTILPQRMVNAAGLFADAIARMVNPQNPWTLGPVRGEYAIFCMGTRGTLALRNPLVYPVPKMYRGADGGEYMTLGIHLTPTFRMDREGNWSIGNRVLVGPSVKSASNPDDLHTDRYALSHFVEAVRPFFPGLKEKDCVLGDVGITARLLGSHRDFMIERDALHPNIVHCVGIDSPGLTSSLAIGRYAARLFSESTQ